MRNCLSVNQYFDILFDTNLCRCIFWPEFSTIPFFQSNQFSSGQSNFSYKKSCQRQLFSIIGRLDYSSRNDFKISEREGWRNLRSALASI